MHSRRAGLSWSRSPLRNQCTAFTPMPGADAQREPPPPAGPFMARRRRASTDGRRGGPRGLAADGSRTRRTRRERPPGGDASPRGAPAPGRAGTKGGSAGSGGDCEAVTAPGPRKTPSVPLLPPRRSPCDCAGLRRPLRPAPRRPLAGATPT